MTVRNGKVDVSGLKIERIRRITGYLTGSVDRWNDGKKAELNDRVKHIQAFEDFLRKGCFGNPFLSNNPLLLMKDKLYYKYTKNQEI